MPQTAELDQLVINKVESEEVFNYMKENGQIVKDQMYLVQDEGPVDGKSAYEIAVEHGFSGTEAEWLASLKGAAPQKGTDYWTADDQQAIVNDVLAALPTWEGGSY